MKTRRIITVLFYALLGVIIGVAVQDAYNIPVNGFMIVLGAVVVSQFLHFVPFGNNILALNLPATAKESREASLKLANEVKVIRDRCTKDRWKKEDEELFDRIMDDHDSLLKHAQRLETVETLEAQKAEVIHKDKVDEPENKDSKKRYYDIFFKYLRLGKENLKAEEIALLESKKIRANVQSTTDAKGGYTIPDEFMNEVDVAMAAFGGMFTMGGPNQQLCRVIDTRGSGELFWPTTNDTANKSYLLAEAGDSETSATDVTFAQLSLLAYKYTTGLIRVNKELIEDSGVDFVGLLRDLLAERKWRGLNEVFTTGDGSSKPNGAVTASYLGVTAAATAVTFNNLIDLKHAVDPAYRVKSTFMFNDATLKAIYKLVDGESRPLWSAGDVQGKVPATILGHPYVINQDMADIGASAKSILFGDFKKYLIRRVRPYEFKVSDQRFFETDQMAYVGFSRVDGDLSNAGTNPLKHLIHASS